MTEYIKREDAIEAFYTATGDGDKADWAVGVIKSIPSADVVERKKGKWMHKEITADFHAIGQCSVCKERRRLDNFCSNCGADMKED